jgi:hypothetical protein
MINTSRFFPRTCGASVGPKPAGGCQPSAWGRAAAMALVGLASFLSVAAATAATIWNGPPITFAKPNGTPSSDQQYQDRMTPKVWFTRDTERGLYNIAQEMSYTDASPADTEWAYGTTADLADLEFKKWVDWHGKNPPGALGQNAVLHLISEDIYINIRFNTWTMQSGGGFSYTRSTPGGGGGAAVAPAIEYYHQGFDHYFITRNPDEIAKLDNGTFVGWARTGQSFNVYASATAGANSVCRFFSTAFDPKSSHFYTPFTGECTTVKGNSSWQFEGEANDVFYIPVGSATGTCAAGTTPVYRLYNNGMGNAPNHRYTTSATTRDQMVAAGWVIEGNGPGLAFMCAPS